METWRLSFGARKEFYPSLDQGLAGLDNLATHIREDWKWTELKRGRKNMTCFVFFKKDNLLAILQLKRV